MKIFDRLMAIDRRIIYIILAIVTVIPLIFPIQQKVRVMSPTEKFFTSVDTIHQDKALIIDFAYDPQSIPEMEPMAFAVLRHAFTKRIKVLALALYVQPLGLAQSALDQIVNEFNSQAQSNADSIIYGRDYVFLGWQPPPIIPIIGMGESITNVYQHDYYGNQTDTLPLMKKIKNYSNVELLVSISHGSIPLTWVYYAQNRFGVQVSAGVVSVSASDFYPYLQSGQFSGLLVGMKGAAEYEELLETRLKIQKRRKASESLSSITFAHIAIIIFIIIGNIGFFIKRRRK
ncbi:hypothetical protein A2Y85_00245 [candidate division WOR-3 bacterium RBG_13_43_14]|uniref:Uncharacterized protein n=1 Tax=candidate division WOR-3 bacterium RBG_13_43_14 TaxID=1802590 RepID=A0A1F4UD93_UNCW3|nr:MAG: hypothetical protein A2Y85_00245 [candidate division WOR-3 bacterium RBG_13_43_14]